MQYANKYLISLEHVVVVEEATEFGLGLSIRAPCAYEKAA